MANEVFKVGDQVAIKDTEVTGSVVMVVTVYLVRHDLDEEWQDSRLPRTAFYSADQLRALKV